ncbi:FAD-binding oxidoreductase [Salibaculum halophilum]|uniref:FAD-binding oxidoreductase n=1 Tax=Salibaculum halophilum TaxID=1914408 RepID=UPI000A0FC08C|nr:FAD-binding oxidoreductase [Salibaculum halophilum]
MTSLRAFTEIVGADHAMIGADTARWARDWTGTYIGAPGVVLRPADTAQVAAILRKASQLRLSVTPVSGNTGLVGGAHAPGGVLLSLDRMNAIREINPRARTATVEAGVILSGLHAAAEAQDLIFPLTFGARGSAMIGGVLSTNAGGSNVLRHGNARDLCLGLEAVLADGRVVDLMKAVHKDNSGLDLRNLLIGSEGQLGVITAAVLKLSPRPRAHATAMVAVPELTDALDLLNRLNDASGGAVEAFEYMPRAYIQTHLDRVAGARPPFDAMHEVNILVDLAATSERDATPGGDGQTPITDLLEQELGAMLDAGRVLDATVARSEAQRAEIWARREAAAELTFWRKPVIDTDVAVPLDFVPRFLELADARVTAHDPGAEPFYIAHLGDGNVHYCVYPSGDSSALKDAIVTIVEDVVTELGGSFSAEHGVGQSKLATMRRRKDPTALAMMRRIKQALDPQGILNPGKTIPD